MKNRILRTLLVCGLVSLLLVPSSVSTNTARAFGYTSLNKIQKRLLSGLADYELNPQNAITPARLNGASRAPAASDPQFPRNYYPTQDDQCRTMIGSNVKINQNCLNLSDSNLQGRGQAQNETSIAADPNQPDHLIASYNDYRRGDGNCYTAYSLDRGQTWQDATVPMSFINGQSVFGTAREYWQSGGDTSVAWDTKGNAYLSCQVFNRGSAVSPNPDQSSGFLVFRSTQNKGASWNFPGRVVTVFSDTVGLGTTLEDKQLMTVDAHAGSPFQDRVYVTWTEFAADGTAYIWESYSADYGETFSPRVLVSGNSSLCVNTYGIPTPQGKCNENQFSQPFTASDGALYVVWANFNNATGHPIGDNDNGGGGSSNNSATTTSSPQDNRNQILLAKSTDGGKTFSAPVKVADYYDLPDCATYQNGQDAGRACVPEKSATSVSIFRATNYPSGAVNPTNSHQVVVTVGSYINVHSNETNGCVPTGFNPNTGLNLYTGVKTPGACNNDILVSVSQDGGATFTGGTTDPRQLTSATQSPGQATTDQFWQWTTFTQDGRLATSYYDRQYGSDESLGFSDVSLSGSQNLSKFNTVRVTSTPMPPPTEFSGLFFGDYAGLTTVGSVAYPIWMDTRAPDLFLCPGTGTPTTPPAVCMALEPNRVVANDQDIFTQGVSVP